MEELKRFQGSTCDTISRRKLIEDRDTILELTGKIQELQNEINCMNDSRDFQDAKSVRSGQSHVTSQPAFFTPFPDPGGMPSRSLGMPSRNDRPLRNLGSAWYIGSSSAPYPQESNPWVSNVSEHTSPHVIKAKHQLRIRDASQDRRPEIHSSQVREDFKQLWCRQQRLQISDLHFDKFRNPATSACWKIRFKTEMCTCSQFPTEAMLWIKEVEMVDSVDDLKSSCSVGGI